MGKVRKTCCRGLLIIGVSRVFLVLFQQHAFPQHPHLHSTQHIHLIMAASPMILVAGASGVGKAVLMSALGAKPEDGSQEATSLHTLRLDTKYYTADLPVHCHEVSSSSNGTPAAPPATTLDQLQALVLVLDAGSSRSHAAAMDFVKALQDREFDIQLLVANKVDSLSGQQDSSSGGAVAGPRPTWLQDARTWCYTNGFEYIEAAAGKPAVDVTLQDEDGEQQGVARVLAALQAHMWPNMQQKTPSQQAAAAAAARTSLPGSSSSSAKDQGTARLPQQSQPLPEQPADSAHAASAAAVDAVPTQQQEQQQQQHQQAKPQQGHAAVLDLDENPFLDGDMDDFEQLMRQVMGECVTLCLLCQDAHHMQALFVRGVSSDISAHHEKPHMLCCSGGAALTKQVLVGDHVPCSTPVPCCVCCAVQAPVPGCPRCLMKTGGQQQQTWRSN
jgi:hypothetical protein